MPRKHENTKGAITDACRLVVRGAGVPVTPTDVRQGLHAVGFDALALGGRLMLPLTAAMPAMGSTLGKGLVVLMTKTAPHECFARVAGVVAVYSAVGVRDDKMNDRLGQALMAGPATWQAIARLRRDAHEPAASCWLQGRTSCVSA